MGNFLTSINIIIIVVVCFLSQSGVNDLFGVCGVVVEGRGRSCGRFHRTTIRQHVKASVLTQTWKNIKNESLYLFLFFTG